jgi:hypothetical protein
MPNIPKSFQDYDSDDPNIDFRKKRWDYWASLRTLRQEYIATTGKEFNNIEFIDYIKEKYGFEINTNSDLEITDNYTIVDEKKFIIYLLKK